MESCTRREAEPYQPSTYNEDDQIPFAPDGNAPLIADGVEKVKGVSGELEDLKCVRKTLVLDSETEPINNLHQKRRIVEEVKILHSAQHHHVIQMIHTYFDASNVDQWKFAIVMDRAEANLHLYLRPDMKPPLQWFACLIGVVCYIHSLGIRHRDIKPSNVLIKGQRILLADFGISQMGLGKTMPTTFQARNSSRTREYCAPEVDQGATRGRSADIFSLGAVFLEMFVACFFPSRLKDLNSVLKPSSRSTPSYAKRIREVQQWIEQSLHCTGWQHDLLVTCSRMLCIDRYSRPCAEDVNRVWSFLPVEDSLLICKCADSVARTKCEELIDACRKGTEGEVNALLGEVAQPNSLGAFHFAAARGRNTMVQALLDAGALVDIRNAVGQTALHCAARNGHTEVVKQLLNNDADVDAKDENDQTALHGAAGHGYETIVRTLLVAGADALAEDLDGSTAAYFAMRRQHKSVQALLEGQGSTGSSGNS